MTTDWLTDSQIRFPFFGGSQPISGGDLAAHLWKQNCHSSQQWVITVSAPKQEWVKCEKIKWKMMPLWLDGLLASENREITARTGYMAQWSWHAPFFAELAWGATSPQFLLRWEECKIRKKNLCSMTRLMNCQEISLPSWCSWLERATFWRSGVQMAFQNFTSFFTKQNSCLREHTCPFSQLSLCG